MGFKQLKICRIASAAAIVVLAVSMHRDSNGVPERGLERVDAPAHAAGFGGVLVPKRVRMILGFVQTLPA
jgi:hypothetical protein